MKCLDFNKAMLYICKVKQLKKLCNANFNESHLLRLLGPVQFLGRQARRLLSAVAQLADAPRYIPAGY